MGGLIERGLISNFDLEGRAYKRGGLNRNCLKPKLYSRMLVVVQRLFHVEQKINKPDQCQALDGMTERAETAENDVIVGALHYSEVFSTM